MFCFERQVLGYVIETAKVVLLSNFKQNAREKIIMMESRLLVRSSLRKLQQIINKDNNREREQISYQVS